MMTLDDIKSDSELLNQINWDMTPEEAVRLYLEWGCNWARSNYVIRSKDDVAHYFVINNWKEKPVIYLIRRNSEEARELAEFPIPPEMEADFQESVAHHKGVYALEGKIKEWLRSRLGVHT